MVGRLRALTDCRSVMETTIPSPRKGLVQNARDRRGRRTRIWRRRCPELECDAHRGWCWPDPVGACGRGQGRPSACPVGGARRVRADRVPGHCGACCCPRRSRGVPELVPIRHGRMLVSPFTYYRGAALPMAADLATTPTSGLRVQLCGDAHLSNFGAFASPERQAGLRPQRLRRDAAGTLRVGRQAAGGEHRGGGQGQRRSARRRSVRRCWRPFRPTAWRCAGSPSSR